MKEKEVDPFYKSKRWRALRESVLRRDGYLCQDAKRYGKLLAAQTVHHIFPRGKYPEYAWEPWNLISLSNQAHEAMHDRTTGRLTDKGWRLLLRTAQQQGTPPPLNRC